MSHEDDLHEHPQHRTAEQRHPRTAARAPPRRRAPRVEQLPHLLRVSHALELEPASYVRRTKSFTDQLTRAPHQIDREEEDAEHAPDHERREAPRRRKAVEK